MKSTFPPFFHFTEFSADQFSKSTALIVKYVFTTYIMIKRYSKHLCTMYILSWHFHIIFGKEQPTYEQFQPNYEQCQLGSYILYFEN